MLATVSEVGFQILDVFQGVEGLVLDFSAAASCASQVAGVGGVDRQIGDPGEPPPPVPILHAALRTLHAAHGFSDRGSPHSVPDCAPLAAYDPVPVPRARGLQTREPANRPAASADEGDRRTRLPEETADHAAGAAGAGDRARTARQRAPPVSSADTARPVPEPAEPRRFAHSRSWPSRPRS